MQPRFCLIYIYIPSLVTHQSVTPAVRSIWANSICTWKEEVYIHTCGKSICSSARLCVVQCVQCWWKSKSRSTWPMTSRLLNEAELFFTATLRRLNLSSSRGRAYPNLTGGAEGGGKWDSRSHRCRQRWRQPRSPLVVLRVMVPLLHCRFLFGGLVFVRQQQEGDIAFHAVFALG